MFYVYEWFIKDTNEIFYVGKGTGNRYKVLKHNKFFNDFVKRYECTSRIIKEFENEKDAFAYEHQRICELKSIGQCVCNIHDGGIGGTQSWWTAERRKEYSIKNVMKSESQRKRMSEQNPMKNKDIAKKVGKSHRRQIKIGNILFETIKDASSFHSVTEHEIYKWLKDGYSPSGGKCFHTDGKIKNIKHPNRIKPTFKKPVIVNGKLFNTMRQACEYIGITPQTLRVWVKDGKIHKGYKCEYANQQPSQGNTDSSTLKGSTTNK